MTKPLIAVIPPEDRNHPLWTVGFNARLANNPRRVNQFPINTDRHAHWDYGWVSADEQVKAIKSRRRNAEGMYGLHGKPMGAI